MTKVVVLFRGEQSNIERELSEIPVKDWTPTVNISTERISDKYIRLDIFILAPDPLDYEDFIQMTKQLRDIQDATVEHMYITDVPNQIEFDDGELINNI